MARVAVLQSAASRNRPSRQGERLMQVRKARRLAVAAAVLVALAQGVAGAATTPASLHPTAPVDATKADLNPDRTYTAPNYAVDPANPLHIVGGFMDLRTRRCGLIRSL